MKARRRDWVLGIAIVFVGMACGAAGTLESIITWIVLTWALAVAMTPRMALIFSSTSATLAVFSRPANTEWPELGLLVIAAGAGIGLAAAATRRTGGSRGVEEQT